MMLCRMLSESSFFKACRTRSQSMASTSSWSWTAIPTVQRYLAAVDSTSEAMLTSSMALV